MSLLLPGNIPVAAKSRDAIERNGKVIPIGKYDTADALATRTQDPYDPVIVWVRPTLRGYKAVWHAAAKEGLVDPASCYGERVDIDHVFPKSWAKLPCFSVAYVRIFPVWGEVNRSAGGGRERWDPMAPGFVPNDLKGGIYFATDLQVRKMLGHPVGSTTDRTEVFSRR